jgi:glyoxylase-like metal-dependent hydrolase (beta-lactamase superfamily II)
VTVIPSELATQPIGEAAPVAEGIWQLKLPVPFPLRFVSAYLVEGEEGWTLIDAGYDYPRPARRGKQGPPSRAVILRRT